MASFEFVPRTTLRPHPTYRDCVEGDRQSLDEVLYTMNAYVGVEEDSPSVTLLFDSCVNWAFVALMRLGGTYVEKPHIDLIVEMSSKDKSNTDLLLWKKFLEWVFLHQWRFSAWR